MKSNILILEPDRVLSSIYSKYLSENKYKLFSAYKVEDALELLDQHKIDIILMELQISGHNGLEFLYEIRSYPEWDDIKIIINSIYQLDNINSLTLDLLNISKILYKPEAKLITLLNVVNDLSSNKTV